MVWQVYKKIDVRRLGKWWGALALSVLVGSVIFVSSFSSVPATATGIDSFVTLMLHMDGTDGSTTFTDSSDSGHTVIVFGDAQIDTAQSQFGGASGVFDGIGDALGIDDSDDFDFSGDFTVDMWIRPTEIEDMATLFVDAEASEVIMFIDPGGGAADLIFQTFDTTISVTCSQVIATGSWQHVAVVRSGTTVTVYDNGVACGSDSSAGTTLDTSGVVIGDLFIGNIDELRTSKGIARWTSDFTPPSQAYSASVVPSAPTLHDSGGSTRIAFNNARQSTTSPTFRVSAASDTSFNRFEIQLATTTDFSSQIYTHTASSTFAASTTYNITADALSPSLPTTDDTTYYVRVRASADSGSTWSSWSTDNHPVWSFTYDSGVETDWYQTTGVQFETGTLAGVFATTSGEVSLIQASTSTLTYVGGAEGSGDSASYAVSLTGLTGGSDSAPQEGDIVLVTTGFVSTSNGNPGVSTSGYTELQDLYMNDETRDTNFSMNWKIMGETPDTSVTCLGSGSGTNGSVCVVHVWRGADPNTPMDVTGTFSGGIDSSIPDSFSISPVTQGAVIIATGLGTSVSVDNSVTAPSGFGNQVDISVDPGNAITGGISSMAWSGSGSVDPAEWTNWTDSTGDSWIAATLALRPYIVTAATTGTTTSTAITFDSVANAGSWSTATITADITDGAVTARILGADTQPLSGYTCTVSGSSCTIDLSTLDPQGTPNHETIYLQAVLTDSGGSPTLEGWSVGWGDPVPTAPALYNDDGGSTQIAFNNSRQNTTAPTFRVSALYDASFDRFQIQLATTSDFTSQTYEQTFSSTYASSTAYNLTANSLSPSLPTTDDTTYYVRVRASADSGSTWSNWSTDNHPVWSFTYDSGVEADWYQTTGVQFGLGTLTDTVTTTGGVELDAGGGSGSISLVGGTTGIGTNSTYAVDLTGLSLQEDDVVLVMNAFMSSADEDPGVTTGGYTEISDLYADGSVNDTNLSVSWKAMGASPDSSVTCNGSSNAARGSVCVVQAWRGVDTTTPMDVTEVEATGTGAGEPNGGSITPVSSGAYVVVTGAGVAANADTSVTAPSGYTNQTSTTTDPGNAVTGAMASLAWTSGAEDPAVWTDWSTTGSGASWGAVTMALRPGAGAATTGTTTSSAIDFDSVPNASGWSQATITADITDGAVTAHILGADTQPLSGYTCTVSGSSCTIDLSTLDPQGTPNHETIYLQAVLTDSGGSPTLEAWSVGWGMGSAPTVTTAAATNVTGSTATLNGNITNTGGETGAGTQHGFAYSTNATLSSGVSTTTLGTYNGTGSFNEGISSLTPGTTYYFRAYAANSAGTSTGSIQSFTTSAAPTVTTNAASSIADTSATLNGDITDTGGETGAGTQHGFAWGTQASLSGGDTATTTLGTYSGTGAFTEGVTSLAASTTYYFRAYAANSAGTTTGAILSFTTNGLPLVTTQAATGVNASMATVHADITDTGGGSITQHGFAYSTNATLASGVSTTTLGAGGAGSFEEVISALDPATTYYFRAYATNAAGTGVGDILNFTTAGPPPVLRLQDVRISGSQLN